MYIILPHHIDPHMHLKTIFNGTVQKINLRSVYACTYINTALYIKPTLF